MTVPSGIALGVAVLAVAASLLVSRRERRRRRVLEDRLDRLDRRLDEVAGTAGRALATADDARRAAEPSAAPRLVLEPVTAPIVKAVALGAGARRAVRRLGRAAS